MSVNEPTTVVRLGEPPTSSGDEIHRGAGYGPARGEANGVETAAWWSQIVSPRNEDNPLLDPAAGDPVVVSVNTLLPADSPRQRGVDPKHVEVLAQSPNELPPIVVHRDTMRVIDGMHRLQAAVVRNQDTVRVRFFEGTADAAFVLAVGNNTAHGLPLTLADRRAAAARILGENPEWSDRVVARIVGLNHKTVSTIRRSGGEYRQLNFRLGQDGRKHPVNVGERRAAVRQLITEQPHAPLREIAKAIGVSPTTVLAVKEGMRSDVAQQERSNDGERREPEVVATTPVPLTSDTLAVEHEDDRLRSLWRALVQDPEVRFTDTGRALLRMLQLHTVADPETWNRLVFAVPPRHTGTVADLAASCAHAWESFAEEVRRRERRT